MVPGLDCSWNMRTVRQEIMDNHQVLPRLCLKATMHFVDIVFYTKSYCWVTHTKLPVYVCGVTPGQGQGNIPQDMIKLDHRAVLSKPYIYIYISMPIPCSVSGGKWCVSRAASLAPIIYPADQSPICYVRYQTVIGRSSFQNLLQWNNILKARKVRQIIHCLFVCKVLCHL